MQGLQQRSGKIDLLGLFCCFFLNNAMLSDTDISETDSSLLPYYFIWFNI